MTFSFLLFIFTFISLIFSVDSNLTCPTSIPHSNNSTYNLHTIFNWCVEDSQCSELYHQSYRTNLTVFLHLVDRRFLKDLYNPIRSLLCAGDTLEDFVRKIWLLTIKANPNQSQLKCDVNHYLSFDANGSKSFCVCRPDKICHDELFDRTPFYILIGLIGFLAVLFFVGEMYRNYKLLRFIEQKANDRTALSALDQILT